MVSFAFYLHEAFNHKFVWQQEEHDFVIINITRKHSSWVRTARLPTIHASVATRFQHQWWGPQVNKFKHVSSCGHRVSLVEGSGIPVQ